MATCVCGAPVRLGQTTDGKVVRLETTASMAGEGRYTVLDYLTRPWRVQAVTAKASVSAHADHGMSCPRR